jgi:hypothetical protein
LTLITLLVHPPARTAYGPVSFALVTSYGMYATGVKGLWGCVLNLKANFDGRGFKDP